MRTKTGTFTLAACLLGTLSPLSGCVYGEMRQVLRTQIASETNCPATKVVEHPVYLGGKPNEYNVSGCGETRRYICPEDEGLFSYDETICTLTTNSDRPKLAVMSDDDDLFDLSDPALQPPPEEPGDPALAPPPPETDETAEETKTEDKAEEAKTEDKAEEAKTEDKAEETKTEDKAEETKTEDKAEEAKTEDKAEEKTENKAE